VVADRLCTLHFPPTQVSRANLAREGIRGRGVRVTGNTIVDAVRAFRTSARWRWERARAVGNGVELEDRVFALATLHRQENVDNPARLRALLGALDRVARSLEVPVVLPMHPRTRDRIERSRVRVGRGVRAVEPLGYLDFVALLERAALVLTDSGGVQEEACVLRVPCVTMRDSTERPESVAVGASEVAGGSPERIVRAAKRMAARARNWSNPFGDGRAGRRIADSCGSFLEGR
jgi:UDP-N-acetylglucosamine 2-epimerase (non-hydrolysing)